MRMRKRYFGYERQNMKVDVTYTECVSVDWIHLTQDTVQWRTDVNTVMTPRVL
jgi:hypothetical protein